MSQSLAYVDYKQTALSSTQGIRDFKLVWEYILVNSEWRHDCLVIVDIIGPLPYCHELIVTLGSNIAKLRVSYQDGYVYNNEA